MVHPGPANVLLLRLLLGVLVLPLGVGGRGACHRISVHCVAQLLTPDPIRPLLLLLLKLLVVVVVLLMVQHWRPRGLPGRWRRQREALGVVCGGWGCIQVHCSCPIGPQGGRIRSLAVEIQAPVTVTVTVVVIVTVTVGVAVPCHGWLVCACVAHVEVQGVGSFCTAMRHTSLSKPPICSGILLHSCLFGAQSPPPPGAGCACPCQGWRTAGVPWGCLSCRCRTSALPVREGCPVGCREMLLAET